MTSPFAQTAPAETGLAIPEIDAAIVFKPGGSTPFIKMVREHVATQNLDISTDDGKNFVRSFAYKIARTKTEGVRRADARMEDAKKLIADVNSEKKFFVAEMEKIHHEVRDPLTLWENRDKERQGAHEQALGEIFDACVFIGTPTIQALKDRLAKIEGYAKRNWEEYAPRATSALEQSKPALEAMLAKAEKAEADRLELEESRRKIKALENEAKERKRQDDLAEAARQATVKAEAKAAEEKQRAAMAPAPKTLWTPGSYERISSPPVKAEPVPPRPSEFTPLALATWEAQKNPPPEPVNIDDEIAEALCEFVDPDQAADIVQAIKDGKIPHVQIVY